MATASSIVSKPMIALLPTSFSSPIQTGGHRTPDRHIQQHNLLMGHQKEGRGNGVNRLEAALSQAQIASTSHRPRQAEKTGRMQSRRVMSTVCELPNVPCHRLGQPQIKVSCVGRYLSEFRLMQGLSVEQASSPSSTPFWEDDYEQRDEQPAPAPRLWTPIPPADEQLASASTSSEGSVVVGEYPSAMSSCV
jgi:hypothetical protein